MEIGLDLTATYEEGEIFEKKLLNINEQEYIDNIAKAHQWSFNLAMDTGIMTPETTELMIAKAFFDYQSQSNYTVWGHQYQS